MSVAEVPQSPSYWAWALLVSVAGILLSLAFWQYQRGEEKAAWLAQHEHGSQSTELAWSQTKAPLDAMVNQPVRIVGRFLPEYKIALDNQPRASRAGVELLVLFKPEASQSSVFINLGWVPSDRNGGPALPTNLPSNGEIFGVVHQPSAFITLGGPEFFNNVWRVGRIEPEAWAARWQMKIVPWVLRLDASVPGAYVRDWSPTENQQFGPERHRAYAFQWLALALAWCGCWYAFWRKGLRRV